MTKQQVICDRCGAEKKDMNCWWQIYPSLAIDNALVIQPYGYRPETVSTHTSMGAAQAVPGDFCSQACAMRALDEWMSRQISLVKAKEKQAKEVAEATEEMGGGVRR